MPEMTFRIRWPDGQVSDCYSPSLVIHDYLESGSAYPVADFLERSHRALGIASDRVEAKYGRPCSLADAQIREIDHRAAFFTDSPGQVEVLSMQPGKPPTEGDTR